MLSTFIKQQFVIKIFVLSILRDRFTQVLLYMVQIKNRQHFLDKNIGMIRVNVILYNLKYSHTQ